jgi:hypothetical protein
MQETLQCDTVCVDITFPSLKFTTDDGVIKAYHVGRGCREFRSGLTFLMMTAPSAEQIKDM